jgi:hypothetical protein
MSLENWYPNITRACTHWQDAEMLQQTFAAFEKDFSEENDAVLGSAKALLEVVCRIIIDEFHTINEPCRPASNSPTLGDWLSSSVKALKLGDERDNKFKKLVSCHHSLADALNACRNEGDPISHGKDPYLAKLSAHHRRSVTLATDAIIGFLFEAFTDSHINLTLTREPYERFQDFNDKIDQSIRVETSVDDTDDIAIINLLFTLPNGDEIPLSIEPSRLLYQLDRQAYISARGAAGTL